MAAKDADGDVAGVIAALRAFQGNRSGRFLQLPRSHAVLPDAATPVPPDGALATIEGEDGKWLDTAALPALMRCAVEIHIYEGPDGVGWVAEARTRSGGKRYVKRVNHGPERWRSHEWREERIA